mmetsp:Transcript_42882/g.110621  ORF Transcript_42882/g.110621 Transcript_42882/m.110621 type:complete len:420 (-) Transcript_42882:7435-8694(-)
MKRELVQTRERFGNGIFHPHLKRPFGRKDEVPSRRTNAALTESVRRKIKSLDLSKGPVLLALVHTDVYHALFFFFVLLREQVASERTRGKPGFVSILDLTHVCAFPLDLILLLVCCRVRPERIVHSDGLLNTRHFNHFRFTRIAFAKMLPSIQLSKTRPDMEGPALENHISETRTQVQSARNHVFFVRGFTPEMDPVFVFQEGTSLEIETMVLPRDQRPHLQETPKIVFDVYQQARQVLRKDHGFDSDSGHVSFKKPHAYRCVCACSIGLAAPCRDVSVGPAHEQKRVGVRNDRHHRRRSVPRPVRVGCRGVKRAHVQGTPVRTDRHELRVPIVHEHDVRLLRGQFDVREIERIKQFVIVTVPPPNTLGRGHERQDVMVSKKAQVELMVRIRNDLQIFLQRFHGPFSGPPPQIQVSVLM